MRFIQKSKDILPEKSPNNWVICHNNSNYHNHHHPFWKTGFVPSCFHLDLATTPVAMGRRETVPTLVTMAMGEEAHAGLGYSSAASLLAVQVRH